MSKYTPPEIEKMLDSMTILVDTREQPTKSLERRIEGFNRPFIRKALSYGDYSAQYIDPSGEIHSLENQVVVERKQNITEICSNFTSGRPRFKREFDRAIQDGAKVHLIIEEDNWEKAYSGDYRSKLNPNSLIASLLSWCHRYNITVYFCKKETTGKLIADIMHYAIREKLIWE